MQVIHSIDPVFNAESRILVLGSFPSVKSRESGFFYGHPQNRFWKVLSHIYCRPLPVTIEEKKAMLLDCGIALWDVIASCEVTGSSDSSIRNAQPNDISIITSQADIRAVFANGTTACRLYNRLILPVSGRECVGLPSTSPANAAFDLEHLAEKWSIIKNIGEI